MNHILEITRDPVWQFIGALITLFALFVTLLIFWLQRQIKSVTYEVVSKNQLLTLREEFESKLQVLYEGEPARDICLLVLKVTNSGNVAVATTDYERPISFLIGTSSKVLSAVITEVEPDNLSAEIEVESSKVSIKPVLLNSKDSITLKLLVSDFSGRISTDARIIGVKKIHERGENGYRSIILFTFVVLMAIGAYIFMTNIPKPEVRHPMPFEAKIGLIIAFFGYFGSLTMTLKTSGFRRLIRKVARTLRG